MFVVTLPRSAAKNPKDFATKAKKAGADILEIRSDLTPDVKPFRSSLPILVTIRGKDKGLIDRLKPAYVDGQKGRGKMIASFHDYKKTPSKQRLESLVKKLRRQKPWAIKIATTVHSYKDLATLLEFQRTLQKQKIRSIVLGMGDKAHLTRVLSPMNNIFTYASLDGFESSATGQLPLSFYTRARMPAPKNKKLKIFGIIGGSQVTHSLSPLIHNALFQRHKIDAVYSCFPSDDFLASIRALSKIKVKGLSVTAPLKHDAGRLAKARGVTNTLVRSGNRWKGYNTDWYGIAEGYPLLKFTRSIAILGAGGAVPSVILGVRKSNRNMKITVFARDPKKAKKELASFNVQVDALKNAAKTATGVVVCAVTEDVSLPMPTAKAAIDLRYGRTTKFMRDAKKRKMRVQDGVPMLIHQALKQFRHFTGKKPFPDDARFLKNMLITHSHIHHGK